MGVTEYSRLVGPVHANIFRIERVGDGIAYKSQTWI